MKLRRLGCSALIALAGSAVGMDNVSTAASNPVGKTVAAELKPDCSMPDGWNQVVARNPRFVIFGESHGTEEAPAFVANVTCALAAKGKRVLVAVEHDSSRNTAFQAAWRLPQPQFEAAIRTAGWKGREDGVASEAMLRLIVELHSLKDKGEPISIVAFNGARDEAQHERFKSLPGQEGHEAAQAENIREAANQNNFDYVLILTGNLHARKHEVARGGFTFKPMAMLLAPSKDIVSLNMQAAKGTSWNCILKPGHEPKPGNPIMADAIECGVHPYSSDADLQRLPFISLESVAGITQDSDYDGIYWLGAVHGSKPAVPKQ